MHSAGSVGLSQHLAQKVSISCWQNERYSRARPSLPLPKSKSLRQTVSVQKRDGRRRGSKSRVCASVGVSERAPSASLPGGIVADVIRQLEQMMRSSSDVLDDVKEKLSIRDLETMIMYFGERGRDTWRALEVYDWMVQGQRVERRTRSLMLVILDEWLKRLIQDGCSSGDITDLVSQMQRVDLQPDVPLSTMLVDLLWERGDQDGVVRMVRQLTHGDEDKQHVEEKGEDMQGQEKGRGGAARSQRGSCKDAEELDVVLAEEQERRQPWFESGRLEDDTRRDELRWLDSSRRTPSFTTPTNRYMSSVGAAGKKPELPDSKDQFLEWMRFSKSSDSSSRRRRPASFQYSEVQAQAMAAAIEAAREAGAARGEADRIGLDAGADLPTYVIRRAVERGEYRAALALPRQMREAGVAMSLDAFDMALLAAVKEQEEVAAVQRELRDLQLIGAVGSLRTSDRLRLQVYEESVSLEALQIVTWAYQDFGEGSVEACATAPTFFTGTSTIGLQTSLRSSSTGVGSSRNEADAVVEELPESLENALNLIRSKVSSSKESLQQQQQKQEEEFERQISLHDMGSACGVGSKTTVFVPAVSSSSIDPSHSSSVRGSSSNVSSNVSSVGVSSSNSSSNSSTSSSSSLAGLWEKMVALHCIAGRSGDAEEALWRMAVEGRVVLPDVFNAVAGACAHDGNHEALGRLLCRMEEMGCEPDEKTYSVVLGGSMKGQHYAIAAASLQQMVEKGMQPDAQITAMLLRILQKEGHVEAYLKLCSSLGHAGLVEPCIIYFFIDALRLCLIRML